MPKGTVIPISQLEEIPNLSGTNTGDQVGDGTTITGAGTIADPFVASSLGSGMSEAEIYARVALGV